MMIFQWVARPLTRKLSFWPFSQRERRPNAGARSRPEERQHCSWAQPNRISDFPQVIALRDGAAQETTHTQRKRTVPATEVQMAGRLQAGLLAMAVALAGGVTFIAIERTTSPVLRAAANIRAAAGDAFLHHPAPAEAPRRDSPLSPLPDRARPLGFGICLNERSRKAPSSRPMTGITEPREADQHHRPSRGFGDGRTSYDDTIVTGYCV